jgi:predicted methyltransferase
MTPRFNLLAAAAALLIACGAPAHSADTITPAIRAAVADAHRPQAEKDLDAERHPAEMMAFAGVKPGDTVIEFIPGRGYVTRLFSKIVGPTGHVYVVTLPSFPDRRRAFIQPVANDPEYSNVTVLTQNPAELKVPMAADIAWISENYHDFKNNGAFHTDTEAMDKAVFAALKPGGEFVISDYASAPGKALSETQTLHRIDPAVVKSEVTAAGFQPAGESNALANANDPHTEHSKQGSDEFFLKFRKP